MMRAWKIVLCLGIALGLLAGCGGAETGKPAGSGGVPSEKTTPQPTVLQVEASEIGYRGQMTGETAGKSFDMVMFGPTEDGVRKSLEGTEKQMMFWTTRFQTTGDDSVVAAINKGPAVLPDADTEDILMTALTMADVTGGAYNPLMAPLQELWREDATPGADLVQEKLILTDVRGVRYDPQTRQMALTPTGMGFDLMPMVPGWAADKLVRQSVLDGMSGGKIQWDTITRAFGVQDDGTPFYMDIVNPADGAALGQLRLSEQTAAVAEIRSHLDPTTGYPVETDLASVTVLVADSARAVPLAQALLVMGKEEALNYWRMYANVFEVILIDAEGQLVASPDLKGRITLDSGAPVTSAPL